MAQSEIKIGEINSYSGFPAFTEPYRNGWQLALEEINAAGGVGGKQIEVISRDDGGKPAAAITAAGELMSSENVAMFMGTFFSNVGLAVSDFANQKNLVSCSRTADRRHHLVKRQWLHLPPTALQLYASGDAGGGSREAAGEELGDDRAEL